MSIKRKLRKLVNTKNAIKKQYLQYPNLDDILFFVYLPNKKGTTKTFKSIETNPEKGLLLDRWYEHKQATYGVNAIAVESIVFTIYTCKNYVGDIYIAICEELNIYLILNGLGELQAFMTNGKLHAIQYYMERKSPETLTKKVLST